MTRRRRLARVRAEQRRLGRAREADRDEWVRARWPSRVKTCCTKHEQGDPCALRPRLVRPCLPCRTWLRLRAAYARLLGRLLDAPPSPRHASGPVRVVQLTDGQQRPYRGPKPSQRKPYKNVDWSQVVRYSPF